MTRKETSGERFRLGELFCGPGGLAYGMLSAKVYDVQGASFSVVHAWATDYDEATCRTYRRNICPDCPETVVCGDIRHLDLDCFHAISEIDALAFGFPCNDFSLVGKQKGFDGQFGPLYQYGVEVLRRYRPKWFVAENVGGLRSANDGNAFGHILLEMYRAGYSLVPHYYSFEKYGVPQARQRIIIVGIRQDLPFRFRVPSPAPYAGIDNSCGTALTEPPIPMDAPNHEYTRQSKSVVERLSYIRPGENAFSANLPKALRLNVKGARISQIYKRLDPARPAYTVTGSGGGGTHMYHWSEPRALTNRERARLQTFPDDYVFEGSKEEVRRQIGMAVPCQGARVVTEAILKTFAGVDYPSIEANFPPLLHVAPANAWWAGAANPETLNREESQMELALRFYERGDMTNKGVFYV